ncbi:MAG TPA: hypothetical protein PK269_10930, partial [Bacteroidales bacterium]|nr:hypothetical protein [Bacteroidales bacterium]
AGRAALIADEQPHSYPICNPNFVREFLCAWAPKKILIFAEKYTQFKINLTEWKWNIIPADPC